MKKIFEKLNNCFVKTCLTSLTILFTVLLSAEYVSASPYTICKGAEFNNRIKMSINQSNDANSIDESIFAFKRSFNIPKDAKLIDISEDGDKSIVAYISSGIIYFVSEDEVSFNKDMSYMFSNFRTIKNIDFSEFDFSKVKDMRYMFNSCRLLTDINFDNDTEIKPTNIEGMFYDCESLTNLNLYMFNTKSCQSFKNLFTNCINIKNIEVTPDVFNSNNISNFSGTFTGCTNLKTNFGRFTKDIDASLFKTYCRCGDEEIEGLLKDVEFEYDDYGDREKFIKPNGGNYSLYETEATKINISSNDKANTLKYIDIELDEESSLKSISVDDTSMPSDDEVLEMLMKETVVLTDEERAAMQKRLDERQGRLDTDIPEDEETVAHDSIPNVRRPSLEEYKKRGVEDGRPIDKAEEVAATSKIFNLTTLFIFIGIIAIIGIGILFHKFKSKDDNIDFS